MTEQKSELATRPSVRRIESSPASRPDPGLPGFEHRFETINGIRLHYVAGGKTGGAVVVFLAGFCAARPPTRRNTCACSKKEGGLRAGLAYHRAAALSARQNRELCTKGKRRTASGGGGGTDRFLCSTVRRATDIAHW